MKPAPPDSLQRLRDRQMGVIAGYAHLAVADLVVARWLVAVDLHLAGRMSLEELLLHQTQASGIGMCITPDDSGQARGVHLRTRHAMGMPATQDPRCAELAAAIGIEAGATNSQIEHVLNRIADVHQRVMAHADAVDRLFDLPGHPFADAAVADWIDCLHIHVVRPTELTIHPHYPRMRQALVAMACPADDERRSSWWTDALSETVMLGTIPTMFHLSLRTSLLLGGVIGVPAARALLVRHHPQQG